MVGGLDFAPIYSFIFLCHFSKTLFTFIIYSPYVQATWVYLLPKKKLGFTLLYQSDMSKIIRTSHGVFQPTCSAFWSNMHGILFNTTLRCPPIDSIHHFPSKPLCNSYTCYMAINNWFMSLILPLINTNTILLDFLSHFFV